MTILAPAVKLDGDKERCSQLLADATATYNTLARSSSLPHNFIRRSFSDQSMFEATVYYNKPYDLKWGFIRIYGVSGGGVEVKYKVRIALSKYLDTYWQFDRSDTYPQNTPIKDPSLKGGKYLPRYQLINPNSRVISWYDRKTFQSVTANNTQIFDGSSATSYSVPTSGIYHISINNGTIYYLKSTGTAQVYKHSFNTGPVATIPLPVGHRVQGFAEVYNKIYTLKNAGTGFTYPVELYKLTINKLNQIDLSSPIYSYTHLSSQSTTSGNKYDVIYDPPLSTPIYTGDRNGTRSYSKTDTPSYKGGFSTDGDIPAAVFFDTPGGVVDSVSVDSTTSYVKRGITEGSTSANLTVDSSSTRIVGYIDNQAFTEVYRKTIRDYDIYIASSSIIVGYTIDPPLLPGWPEVFHPHSETYNNSANRSIQSENISFYGVTGISNKNLKTIFSLSLYTLYNKEDYSTKNGTAVERNPIDSPGRIDESTVPYVSSVTNVYYGRIFILFNGQEVELFQSTDELSIDNFKSIYDGKYIVAIFTLVKKSHNVSTNALTSTSKEYRTYVFDTFNQVLNYKEYIYRYDGVADSPPPNQNIDAPLTFLTSKITKDI